jgi:peptidoglycan hydrolase CwlO-like protein
MMEISQKTGLFAMQIVIFFNKKKYQNCLVVLSIGFLLLNFSAIAKDKDKDLVDERYQVRVAQKEYDSADRDYKVLSASIVELEKRISQQNQQLESLKKELPPKEARLNKAQKVLEEKQKRLDKAWEDNKM